MSTRAQNNATGTAPSYQTAIGSPTRGEEEDHGPESDDGVSKVLMGLAADAF